MNDSNYKRVKHHHFPGDLSKKQKIIQREVSSLSGERKTSKANRWAIEPIRKSTMRQCQQERTRAVLKERQDKEVAESLNEDKEEIQN